MTNIKNKRPRIPVFLASNDKFAPFVATTMASICANTYNFIDFYVLDSGISACNKQKIRDNRQYFDNFSIEFIKVDCDKRFARLPKLKHISRDMYSRFLIPEILPDCEKVVYTDVDIIAKGDIAELFATDMQNHILAAIPEPDYRKEVANQWKVDRKRLNLSPEHQPFNSGLLLINCKCWNQQNINDKLLKVTEFLAQNNLLHFPDQDILNKCFDNDYLILDRSICIFPKHLTASLPEAEAQKAKDSANFLHYVGAGIAKPWNNHNIFGSEEFWKYVSLTDFENEIHAICQTFSQKRQRQNFLRQIFSISNQYKRNKKYKVITFLGIKINFLLSS